MSLPLNDFRVGCTELTTIALGAAAAATGETRQAIARDVLHQWALREHAKYTVFARGLVANGLQPSLPGFDVAAGGKRRVDDGSKQEDAGASRHGRRR